MRCIYIGDKKWIKKMRSAAPIHQPGERAHGDDGGLWEHIPNEVCVLLGIKGYEEKILIH